MRDFDAEREDRFGNQDRKFKIAGELFEIRPSVKPEVIFDIIDVPREGNPRDTVDLADETIKAGLLDEEMRSRWDRIRDEADPPISGQEIAEISQWCIEVWGARPTVAPPASQPGGATTGTSSTDSSSTPPAEASAA